MNIVAITVNWNQAEYTLQCVESLAKQSFPPSHIYVIDNGSTDDSLSILKKSTLPFDVIESPRNLGFSGGYNLGIQHAKTLAPDAYLIINNDAWLHPKALEIMSQYINHDIGAISPLIFYASQPDVIWAAGGSISPLTLEKKDDLANKQLANLNLPDTLTRDFIPACILLIPQTTIEDVGFFDPRYYLYYEDIDFALRLKHSNKKMLLCTNAHAWHNVSISSGGADSPQERYWMAKSSVIYFSKHASLFQLPLIIPYRLGSAIRTTFRLLFQRKYRSVTAYWRGLYDGLREIGK